MCTASQEAHRIFITETFLLLCCRENVSTYSENHAKHILTPSGQIKASNGIGAVVYRSASSGQFINASVINTTYKCKLKKTLNSANLSWLERLILFRV